MDDTIGIILAGGLGTRLRPLTTTTNKHLLPVYNKPMIYYPLSVLMLSGIKNIIIVSDKKSIFNFKKLFNDGQDLGIKINYVAQKKPNGIPECFLLTKNKIKNKKTILILGDNFFFGQNFPEQMTDAINSNKSGCTFFGYNVSNPENYAVINKNRDRITIEEKPKIAKSSLVIPGIYIFDKMVSKLASKLKKSKRGELEIVDLIKKYLIKKDYQYREMKRGVAWLDMGSFNDLVSASSFIQSYEERQNLMIGSPEEIAWRTGNINKKKIVKLSKKYNNEYGKYLLKIVNEKND
jgi:glucose-1-phosphate thymidylyltransferase